MVWNPWEEGVGCGVDSLGRGGKVYWRLLGKRGRVSWRFHWEKGVGCGGDSLGKGGRVWWRLLYHLDSSPILRFHLH